MLKNTLLGTLYLVMIFILAIGGYAIKGLFFTELTESENTFMANAYVDKAETNGLYYLWGMPFADKNNAYSIGKEVVEAGLNGSFPGMTPQERADIGLPRISVQEKYKDSIFDYEKSGLKELHKTEIISDMLENTKTSEKYSKIYSENSDLVDLSYGLSEFSLIRDLYDLRLNSAANSIYHYSQNNYVMSAAEKLNKIKVGLLIKEQKYDEAYKYIIDKLGKSVLILDNNDHIGIGIFYLSTMFDHIDSLLDLNSEKKLNKEQLKVIRQLVSKPNYFGMHERLNTSAQMLDAEVDLKILHKEYQGAVLKSLHRVVLLRAKADIDLLSKECSFVTWRRSSSIFDTPIPCNNPFYAGDPRHAFQVYWAKIFTLHNDYRGNTLGSIIMYHHLQMSEKLAKFN